MTVRSKITTWRSGSTPTFRPLLPPVRGCAKRSGRPDHAIHDFDMALQLAPKEVGLYYDRGNARRETGDWRGALADYDQAVVLAPEQAENYVARGWSRLGAGVEGGDFDARVYLQLKGWHDGFSPYMAILAVLGARQAQRPADADRVLDEALANLSPRAWPVPVLRYLRGQLSEDGPVPVGRQRRASKPRPTHSSVSTVCEPATARPALRHLHWARDNGTAGSIAADVARAVLSRVEPASP